MEDGERGGAGDVGRTLVRALVGAMGVPLVLAALWLVLTGARTWSGVLYTLALAAFVASRLVPPRSRAARRLSRGALAVAALTALGRLVVTAPGGRSVTLEVWGGERPSDARWLDRLVDEADIAVGGARLPLGDDAATLPDAMREAFVSLRREEGSMPSPALATFFGLQRPSAFDVVVSRSTSAPRGGVVFLHGSGGAFAQPCVQLAHNLASLGVVTACPSLDVAASWETRSGREVLARTADRLAALGAQDLVLVGLSQGGIAASTFAAELPRERYRGLVLVSGVDDGAPAPGMPSLIVHGEDDQRVPFELAKAYADRAGSRTAFFAGAAHFVYLVRGREVDEAVRTFVDAVLPR